MLAQHSDRAKHGRGTTGGAYMGVARVRDGAPLRRIDIKASPEPALPLPPPLPLTLPVPLPLPLTLTLNPNAHP